MNCVICHYDISNSEKLIVKEMMLGLRDTFEYYQCSNCDALQIKEIPKNISDYYKNYYTENKKFVRISIPKKVVWLIRSKLALSKLYKLFEVVRYNAILHWVNISKLKNKSLILDVGCGNGDILYEFSKHGFKKLFGIDPNLLNKTTEKLQLEKADLLSYETESKFDFIMFNHSFEHIYEHHETLKKALSFLNNNGTIMIRIPVVNKAFEIYRENWVQLDAPRHFVIHSLKSMKLLCEMNNLEIFHYFFDSTAFQFLGSEQFKKGISSYAPNSYKINLSKSIFTQKDLEKYNKLAKEFNSAGLGDQAAFFIRRKK